MWVAISKVNWEASPPSSRSPYSSSTVSASRQQLNFRTHSPKWSKYLANWLSAAIAVATVVVAAAANYDKQQLSEICAGELGCASGSFRAQSQPSPGRCLIRSKLFVAPV